MVSSRRRRKNKRNHAQERKEKGKTEEAHPKLVKHRVLEAMRALFTLCFMFLTTGVADSQSPGCSVLLPESKQSFESVPIPGTRRKSREKEKTRHDS